MSTVEQRVTEAEGLFDSENFVQCRQLCKTILKEVGESHDATKRLKMLVRKCNLNAELTEEEKQEEEAAKAAAAEAVKQQQLAAKANEKPHIRNEWFQTADKVTFTFYVKNRTEDQIQVDAEGRSLMITIDCGDGRSFQASYDPLFSEIKPEETKINVRPPKVEITVTKAAAVQWAAAELQGDAAAAVAMAAQPVATPPVEAMPATQQQLKYPNSKGKDWSSFKPEEEEDEKAGDPLNSLFKKIYGDADEDTRRAMMKSFQESNGTVLSTNWGEVGAKEVTGEAPKGMELKHMGS